jgi:hypothetical protein
VTTADVSAQDFASVNPGAWTIGPTPTTPWSSTTSALCAIWGSGPDDVWAVGDGGMTVHWDGASWSTVWNPTHGPEGGPPVVTYVQLTGLWGAAPDDVWAVGGGALLHWNGTSWALGSPPPVGDYYHPRGMNAVWGSSSTDAWMVGDYGLTAHWNGVSWVVVPNPLTGTDRGLSNVWGTGPSDVWAVGPSGTILHWNGSSWAYAVSWTNADLYGIWGTGPNDVWATGISGTVLHWDGSAWSSVTNPLAGDGMAAFAGAWGTASDDVWVFGRGRWDEAALGYYGNIMHWDGSAWSLPPDPWSNGASSVRGMWGSGPGDVWSVGWFGIGRLQR